jgi:hypothetical protein
LDWRPDLGFWSIVAVGSVDERWLRGTSFPVGLPILSGGKHACQPPSRKFSGAAAPAGEKERCVEELVGSGAGCPSAANYSRDTHRVAISNHRRLRLEGEEVVFTWRDRAHGDRRRTMRLHAHEFLRRFLLHVLPDGFVRIRSYGLLVNRDRQEKLARCREALGVAPAEAPPPALEAGWAELLARLTGTDPNRCPRCGTGRLHLVAEIPAAGRGPPPARRAS